MNTTETIKFLKKQIELLKWERKIFLEAIEELWIAIESYGLTKEIEEGI